MRTPTIIRVLSAACVGIGMACASSTVLADSFIAADSGSNYDNITNPWIDGSNGGTGFSPWSITPSGTASTTIASSPIGTSSWEMSADDSSSILAKRGFPDVAKGSISLDLDASSVDSGGYLQIIFLDSVNFPAFELEVNPSVSTSLHPTGSQDYLFFDGTGATPIDTGVVANGNATHLSFGFNTTADTYVATLTQTGGGSYTSSPNPSPLSGFGTPIDEMWFIDSQAGSPFYVNNLVVVPLPTALIAAIPLIGLMAIRRLRLSI